MLLLLLTLTLELSACAPLPSGDLYEQLKGDEQTEQEGTADAEQKASPDLEQTIYAGYDLPESFSDEAVAAMTALTPVRDSAQLNRRIAAKYSVIAYADMIDEAAGPWQLRIDDPSEYLWLTDDFLYRYILYYEDPERGSEFNPEKGSYNALDVISQNLLCGDFDNYVCRVLFREYAGIHGEDYTVDALTGAQIARDGNDDYIYYDWTIQVQRVGSYVFELTGVAETSRVLEALKEAYPDQDYSDLASLDPISEETSNHARLEDDAVTVFWKQNGVQSKLPVDTDTLLDRGDQMNGPLTELQNHSYVVDDELTAFAYGGSTRVPVSVIRTTDQGEHWQTTVITHRYTSVRQLFLCFPDARHGYLVLTCDRTMWQECSILFRTADGGATWEEVGNICDRDSGSHSLTLGVNFISAEVGFLGINSSDEPNLWRTEDGGSTWEPVSLTQIPQYYTLAYPPEENDDTLCLYLSMTDYTQYGGTKAKYTSEDLGASWTFAGYVFRK